MCVVIFWLTIGYLFYIYFGYFILLHILSTLSSRGQSDGNNEKELTVSLLISAYNEENVIEAKLNNALNQTYSSDMLTIYLVSDGSTDRTIEIANKYNAANLIVVANKERKGKNACLNEIIKDITSDIVVFSDANAMYKADAIEQLIKQFRYKKVGCVVGKESRTEGDEHGVASSDSLYWRYENKIKELQSSLGSVVVANGPIFAIRTELYSELYNDVANDFQSPIIIGGQGYANVFEPKAVSVEKPAQNMKDEFARKVRIVTRGITGYFRLRGHIKGRYLFHFVSHKLLRWLAGFAMILAFVSNVLIINKGFVYTAFLVLQGTFYIFALLGTMTKKNKNKVFTIASYFAMVNFAAFLAWFKYISGQRTALWEKAASTRQ